MKKVLFTLMAALAVMACNKNNQPNDNNNNNNNNNIEEEETSLIVIDGQFKDWDDADVVTAVLPDEAEKVSVLVLKAVADEKNIYVYFEQELEEGQAVSPFDLFLDTDGNAEKGASCYLWPEGCGWEYLVESEDGFLANATTVQDMSDMKLYHFIGPDGADGWDDPDETDDVDAPYQECLEEFSGFASSAGVVVSGVAKVEVAISREIFGKNLAQTIGLGLLLYEGDSWKDNGVLPQDGDGMLMVKLP